MAELRVRRERDGSGSTRGTVLIVDDSPENVGFLLEYFVEVDYRVLVALNGEEALARLTRTSPDLILLDIIMPGLNGFEVCARIKSDPTLRDIPVIFMSALTDPGDKLEAFGRGAVDYITKPVNKHEVLARVETHVSLMRLQEQQRQRNDELQAFSRMVAHDLRTPLTEIIGRAELLADSWGLYRDRLTPREPPDRAPGSEPGDDGGNDIVDEFGDDIECIGEAAQAMNRTIDALLLLAGIVGTDVALAPVTMPVIIAEATRDLAGPIRESGAQLTIADEMPTALGYGPWLKQVWCNLISNAIKYGGDPPVLTLGATAGSNPTVTFWIRDNGPGIPERFQRKIFQPFTRLDHPTAPGHGIGLSIVERVITKLGGTVGAHRLPRGGSEFHFTLRRPE